MERLRVDDVLRLLPELDELTPLVDGILATSGPDVTRRWTASGELETMGQRVVSSRRLEREVPGRLDALKNRLQRVYAGVTQAVGALETGDREGAASALVEVAEDEERAGHPDRAEAYARAAYDICRGERSRVAAVHALRLAARAARTQGRLTRAARDYEEAYEMALDAKEAGHARVAAIGRGNVSVDRGRWAEAQEWYRKALDLLDPGARTAERWHVLVDLSITTRNLGDLDASREFLTQATAAAEALGDDSAWPTLWNASGLLHRAGGRDEEAETELVRALGAAKTAKARVTIAVNLAETLLDRRRWLEAAELGRDAEATALRHGVVTKLPEVYRLLGRIASERGQADAMVFFERALEVITRRELPEFERALTLEAYATSYADAAGPSVRAWLDEAASIFEGLGNEIAATRVRDRLDKPPEAVGANGEGGEQ